MTVGASAPTSVHDASEGRCVSCLTAQTQLDTCAYCASRGVSSASADTVTIPRGQYEGLMLNTHHVRALTDVKQAAREYRAATLEQHRISHGFGDASRLTALAGRIYDAGLALDAALAEPKDGLSRLFSKLSGKDMTVTVEDQP